MQLAVHVTGEGSRTAVLVHGIMSDSQSWDGVAQDLEARGFRVIAVDLAGHGDSPRAHRYSIEAWAQDVLETIEPLLDGAPDLVMGHSLGGLVASIVAERIAPRAVIYVDPAFDFPKGIRGALFKLSFALMPPLGRRDLRRLNPKWSAKDIETEFSAQRRWHRRTMLGLVDSKLFVPPTRSEVPSLVVLAERSLLVTRDAAFRMLRAGMRVVKVEGAGHSVWRDQPERFTAIVGRWLANYLPAHASTH
ncbi:MAG TPA: alpha/beta hydrolase [Microbacteriaceae bacterium]|nr:alpha/beta hydrolase [Microbacteriaceae bacterium]